MCSLVLCVKTKQGSWGFKEKTGDFKTESRGLFLKKKTNTTPNKRVNE